MTALEDLKPVIEKLYNAKPTGANESPLWSLYYNQSTKQSHVGCQPLAENLHHVSPPVNELDFDVVVAEARSIFEKMYPGEEWFPETKEPTAEPETKDSDEEETVGKPKEETKE